MSIEAKIIADSVSQAGVRITTMQLRYPRFVHAEFMTHRVFSRNASSSRAIPVERMIADLRRDPAMPVFWGSNRPGMQAGAELDQAGIGSCKREWLFAMEQAIGFAEAMVSEGLHKQIANRILEPWAHINVVVTATEWKNFFQLRCHSDAQPEMRALADAMREAQIASTPVPLGPRMWHLPYVGTPDDLQGARNKITANGVLRVVPTEDQLNDVLIKVSVARCARVSYLTHDGKMTTVDEDVALYDRLVGSIPLHASPAEHQATPDEGIQHGFDVTWMNQGEHGNFVGWRQYRKMIEGNFG